MEKILNTVNMTQNKKIWNTKYFQLRRKSDFRSDTTASTIWNKYGKWYKLQIILDISKYRWFHVFSKNLEMPAYYMHRELKQKTETMTSLEEIFRGTTDSIASMNQKINDQSTWKEMECLIYFK